MFHILKQALKGSFSIGLGEVTSSPSTIMILHSRAQNRCRFTIVLIITMFLMNGFDVSTITSEEKTLQSYYIITNALFLNEFELYLRLFNDYYFWKLFLVSRQVSATYIYKLIFLLIKWHIYRDPLVQAPWCSKGPGVNKKPEPTCKGHWPQLIGGCGKD